MVPNEPIPMKLRQAVKCHRRALLYQLYRRGDVRLCPARTSTGLIIDMLARALCVRYVPEVGCIDYGGLLMDGLELMGSYSYSHGV